MFLAKPFLMKIELLQASKTKYFFFLEDLKIKLVTIKHKKPPKPRSQGISTELRVIYIEGNWLRDDKEHSPQLKCTF